MKYKAMITMDNKLTDSEIVKALDEAELFLRNRVMDGQSLKLNDYDIGILRKISQTCAKAYDEINRLQAENKRLNKEVDRLSQCVLYHDGQIVDAKTEAYKECIEKVKTEAENATCVYEPDRPQADNMVYHISNIRLDNLLKELVGEDNA